MIFQRNIPGWERGLRARRAASLVSGLARIHGGLVAAAKAGDTAALDRLHTVSQPDLMRFARRTCGAPCRWSMPIRRHCASNRCRTTSGAASAP